MIYTLKTDHLFSVEHGSPNITIFGDYKAWREELKELSPTLYHLPAETFTQTIRPNGIPTNEWTTTKPVQPMKIERVTPEMVMETGGQLIFLQPEIDDRMWGNFSQRIGEIIKEGPAHQQIPGHNGRDDKQITGVHLLRELQDAGLIEHYLNAETGINPIDFPKSESGSKLLAEELKKLKSEVWNRREGREEDKLNQNDITGFEGLRMPVTPPRRGGARRKE